MLLLVPVLAGNTLLASATDGSAQGCRVIGNSYFCSDGRAGQREQPSVRLPSGNRLQGDRYSPDATDASRRGDPLFVEPNRVRRLQRAQRIKEPSEITPKIRRPRGVNRIGPKVLNPDGSTCTVIGNQQTCY